jgi:transcriptional regulator with XRE-family HTH domain
LYRVTIRAGENLKALLARVKRATTLRGKKSELARFLGVSRQRITNWLSLDCAPNGEVTLLMLDWVTAEEEKQNKSAPGSASNTARSKTRSTQSDYEKRKTSPKRG